MTHIVNGLIFSLEWQTPLNNGQKELRDHAEAAGANAYAEVIWGNVRKYGFCNLKKAKGIRSAAAIVTNLLGDDAGVFVHDLGNNISCCIVVDKHLPVDGYDVIGPRDEMIAKAKAFIADRPANEVAVRLLGDLTEAELASHGTWPLPKLANVEECPLSKLEESVGIGIVKGLGRSVDKRVFIGIAMVVGVLGAWFGFDIYEAMQPQRPQQVISPIDQYRQELATKINSVVDLHQFPNEVLEGFIPFAEGVEWKVRGWQLETIACTKEDCVITWKRGPGATARDIIEGLGLDRNAADISFPDIDHCTRKVKFKPVKKTQKLMLVPQTTFAELILSLLHELKDKGYNPTISTMTALVPADASLQLTPADKAKVGTYEFQLPYRASPGERDLWTVAQFPPMITIEHITLDARQAGKVEVTLKGNFYAL